ncbi:MAG: TetR/AcrR family transcriptional regulator [Sedimentitalea sp.]
MILDKSPLETDALSPTLAKILLAAEAEFAQRGFDGAGMKAISMRAEVSQALLHYHFGTKDRLYSEVIAQRSKKINEERHMLLNALDLRSGTVLEGIFDALFRPPLGPAGGDKSYARIFSGLVVGRERDQILVKQHYDPTAQAFVRALQSALGAPDRAVAAQSYTFALGALIAVIGRDGRIERLMGNDDQRLETEDILLQLITFCKGGVLALAAAQTT